MADLNILPGVCSFYVEGRVIRLNKGTFGLSVLFSSGVCVCTQFCLFFFFVSTLWFPLIAEQGTWVAHLKNSKFTVQEGRKNLKRKNSLCLAQQTGHSWGKQSPGHCEGHGLTALGGFSSCIYR